MRVSTLQGSVSCVTIVCYQVTVQMHAANRRFVQCLVVAGNTKFRHVYHDNVDQVTNAENHSNDNDGNQLGVADV